ncbi:MAG: RDD family protein [Pirellulaceae bacterium]|nr:RDD family protein [Planctomycetales bacterium]
MSIEFSCNGCMRMLRVPDEAAGKKSRCPGCGTVTRIPEPVMATALGASPTSSISSLDMEEPPVNEPTDEPPAAVTQPKAIPAPLKEKKPTVNPYQTPDGHAAFEAQRCAELGMSIPATRGARFTGALIDGMVRLVAAAPGLYMYVAFAESDEQLSMAGMLILMIATTMVSAINWILVTSSGQTIGKKIVGTRIVSQQDEALPGFLRGVVLRMWVPGFINQVCGLFSIVDALYIFKDDRRCVHDLMANTKVIAVATERLDYGDQS